jgi:hypothetical protein
MLTGKIFSFDGASGKGLIVLSNGEKLSFGAEHWADTENMPAVSMAVEVDQLTGLSIRSSAKNVAAIQQTQTIEPAAQSSVADASNVSLSLDLEKEISEYINDKITWYGYKIDSRDMHGFVMSHKRSSLLITCVGMFICVLLILPLQYYFGWWPGMLLSITIGVAIGFIKDKRDLIEGRVEGETVYLTFVGTVVGVKSFLGRSPQDETIYLTGDDNREFSGENPTPKGLTIEELTQSYVDQGYEILTNLPDYKLLQPPNSLFDRLVIENKAGEIVVYDPNK